MPELTLNFLGPFQARSQSAPLEGFDSDKVRALLAYLAVEADRPQPREKLAGLLWPDYPESSARTSLRRALANLRTVTADRQADPSFLLATRQSIQFNQASSYELDVAAFEAALQGVPEAQSLEKAVSLYRGPFLDGFSLADSTEFEDWLLVTRETLQRKFVDTLRTLSKIYADSGNIEAALDPAYRLVETEPFDEPARRHLMRLLANAGRQAEALGQYESLKKLLQEQLAVEPAQSSLDLYEQIRSGNFEFGLSERKGNVRGYDLQVQVGHGKFGVVYQAYQSKIRRDVAIKVINPEYADRADFIRQFEEEAQLVAQLEHPHIVPLYDYWREPGGAFLVMRMLQGGSLADSLEKGAWKSEAAVRLIEHVASALHAAHRRGVVHRDVKPANILLDEDGNAYLSDFGIAMLVDPLAQIDEPDLATTSGSLGYLSPESVKGGTAQPAADIYSLGVVLYEILVGEHPFPDLSGESLIEKHRTSKLPAISSLREDISPAIDQVIWRATEKDPLNRYNSTLEFAAAFRAVIEGQDSQLPQTAEGEAINPYKGLLTFQQADAENFFGREVLTSQLLSRLETGSRFLALIGPSGSGKSSVVKAGLLPAIRAGKLPGSEDWFVTEMAPGEHPFEALETALLRVAVNPPEQLLGQLQADTRGLLRAAERSLPDESGQLVLYIDQFEELFTMTTDENQRAAFLDGMRTAVEDPRSRLTIVVTLRADFYDRPLAYPEFGPLLKENSEIILPMTAEELTRAIEKPAQRVGIDFESGLTAIIVADVLQQPGSLPLLQFALTELFEHRSGPMITLASYRDGGGVTGALGKRAEDVYSSLNPQEQLLARQIFLRMITPGDGMNDIRRRVLRSEIEGLAAGLKTHEESTVAPEQPSASWSAEHVIEILDSARLFSFNRDPATREPTVEIAHEALLREWKRLLTWSEEYSSALIIQRRLQTGAEEWEQSGRDESALLRGTRLTQFESWSLETSLLLSPLENAFLEASLASRDLRAAEEADRQAREKALERRSRLILRVLAGVFGLAAVISIMLTLFAFDQRDIARSLALSASSSLALNAGETDRALALAYEATSLDDPPAASELALAEAAYAPATRHLLQGHAMGRVYSLDLNNTADLALSGGVDRSVLLWDVQSGEVLQRFGGFDGSISTVRFLPGDERALVGVLDSTIRIIDLKNGNEHQRILPRPQFVSAAFTGDGALALWPDKNGQLRLLDLAAQNLVRSVGPIMADQLDSSYTAAAFLPGSDAALVGTVSGSIALWDLESDKRVLELSRQEAAIEHLIVSQDGRRALSADANGHVSLWDLETNSLAWAVTPQTIDEKGFRAAFLTHSNQVLIGKADGSLSLHKLATGETIAALGMKEESKGHGAWVTAILAAPDGSAIVSAGADGLVIGWDLENQSRSFTYDLSAQIGMSSSVLSLDISPDGQRLAAGHENGVIAVWDLQSGALLNHLSTNFWNIESMQFAVDGESIVFSTLNGGLYRWIPGDANFELLFEGVAAAWPEFDLDEARATMLFSLTDPGDRENPDDLILWDLQKNAGTQRLPGNSHVLDISALSISPDGTKAVSGDSDGGLMRWDLAAGSAIGPLPSHGVEMLAVDFSPDGSLVVTSSIDGGVFVWDFESGDFITEFPIVLNAEALQFSPDGQNIYTGSSGGGIQVWDVYTGQEVDLLAGHANIVWDLVISRDGQKAISSAEDGFMRIWDLGHGADLGMLAWPGYQFGAAVFSDGKQALTGADGDLLLWDLEKKEVLDQLTGHNQQIFDITLSDDNQIAISSSGSVFVEDPTSVILWDLKTREIIHTLEGEGQIYHVAIDPQNKFAAVSARLTSDFPPLFLWNLQTGKILDRFGLQQIVNPDSESMFFFSADAVAFSPDGSRLFAGLLDPYQGNYAGLWDVSSGELLHPFAGHEFSVVDVAISPDGQSGFSAAWDRNLIQWDFSTGDIIQQFTGRNTDAFSVAVSPDGRYLLSGFADGTLALWDIASGETVRTYSGHQGPVGHVVFGPGGEFALTSALDGTVRIWRIDRTLGELRDFVLENRYLPELDCATRAEYQIEPLCE